MKRQYVVYCPETNEILVLAMDNITLATIECYKTSNLTLEFIGEL